MLFYNKLFYSIMSAAAPLGWKYTVKVDTKTKNPAFPGRPTDILIRKYDNEEEPERYIDETRKMIEKEITDKHKPRLNVDYTIPVNKSGYDAAYHISQSHPNILMFDDLYDDGLVKEVAFGGSRRRRPSRKYKKSKRVLRRKSRSTRRR